MIENIEKWIIAKQQLKEAKESELRCRADIYEEIAKTHSTILPYGKQSLTIKHVEGSYKVIINVRNRFTIDSKELKAIWPSLSTEEYKIFKFKPDLIMSEYEKIPEQSMVHTCIQQKPAMCTLKIEEI